ncbi:MAG: division/cell wall cluster transcriptional repressor MraZ [Zoogloeaceae bacterium]|jgi:MraZ protein|nr:division/cell wall cluster transcriptional repressor MraZ [Zoogloeaceae bacterium]
MLFFTGSYPLLLDSKGRFVVPASFRKALADAGESELKITSHPDGCLRLYPRSVWQEVEQRMVEARFPGIERWRRVVFGNAWETLMDSAGRLLLSPELRAFAHMGKKIWMAGSGRYFEIWSEEGWQKQMDCNLVIVPVLPPEIQELLQ